MRKLIYSVVILSIIMIGVVGWVLYQSRGRIPTFAFGGSDINILLQDKYSWQQRDARWKDNTLANKVEAGTLGDYGCTISSIAVALSNLGLEIDPATLNNDMTSKGGFTDRGWLIWSAIEQASNGKAKAKAFYSPSRDDIDACLIEGQYPIVKYLIGGAVQHWVPIIGKQNGQYLIRDPLIQTQAPQILSHYTPIILSVRCIGLIKPANMDSLNNTL